MTRVIPSPRWWSRAGGLALKAAHQRRPSTRSANLTPFLARIPAMRRLLIPTILAILVGVGCDHGTRPSEDTVASISLAPAADSTVVGGTLRLTATAKDSTGATLDGHKSTWSSSDPAVATVSGSGVVTGVAPGTVRISATIENETDSSSVEVKDGAVVGAAGATVTVRSGTVALAVPASALAEPIPIGIEPAVSAPDDARLVSGTAFTFTPEGTMFATPASLTVAYAASSAGVNESTLRLFKLVAGGWQEVPGSGVDASAHTVTAPIVGFSTYAVLRGGVDYSRRLVYQARGPLGEDLFTIEPDGSGNAALGLDPAIQAGEIDDPAWAPGHGRIAFSAKPPAPDNEEYDVFVVNPDGSGLMDLTNTPTENEDTPTWSPDGTRIAFAREGGIWIMNADGTGATLLAGGDKSRLDWSPDGTRISFEENGHLFAIRVDGSGVAQLTSFGPGVDAYDATWSPDGARLAFTFFDGMTNRIFTVNADGSSPAPLLGTGAGEFAGPAWSPDGSRIAFRSVEGHDVYAANADGSGLVRLGILVGESFAWR